METETVTVELVAPTLPGGFWEAVASIKIGGHHWYWCPRVQSRSRALAVSYALTEAALVFERGEKGHDQSQAPSR